MKKHAVIALVAWSFMPLAHASIPKKLNPFAEGERLVYTRVVEAYRHNNLTAAHHQREVLEKNYPSSVHLDNAYYLTGVLAFQSGRMADAVRDFSVVTDRFPESNKRPAALFAKAATYQRLGLKNLGTRLLSTLVKEYPGSPESQRAWMQLKVAHLESGKH